MIIEARNIEKRFGRHEALSGLSFSVAEGSVYALIGANGTGKTTTIKMMMNIIAPTLGDLAVMGTPSRKLQAITLARSATSRRARCFQGKWPWVRISIT